VSEKIDLARFFVCGEDELGDQEIRQVTAPGAEPVAVYRINGEFYATDDTCSHGQAQLSEGEVDEEGVVECPWHAGTFDIRTGKPLSFPCVLPIKVYPVIVDDGKVYVNLEAGRMEAVSD
jgi:nitrite reductase/ring-hydroxylating ferredoxin subunit